jgi:predicted ester cyclase
MVAEGDEVAIAWTWDATHQGDVPGFPATGKHLAMSGLTVYPVKDGRITGHWQVADRLTVGQQLMAHKA